MRIMAIAASLFAATAAGCSAVSTAPFETPRPGQLAAAGMPYALPKAVVGVKVVKGGQGIGLVIEDPQIVADPEAGTLVARLQPSPFNKEDMKLATNPATGLLISVSSISEAKLLAIIEELAKSVGRAGMKKSMMKFLEANTPIFEDTFDPLSPADTTRINNAINAALAKVAPARARAAAAGGEIDLTVQYGDEREGYPRTALRERQETQPTSFANCQVGVCVRAMTSRVIRVSANGATLATKSIAVPSREAIAVPVPQTILANQKVTVTIKDGVASGYDLERDSEFLGIAKIPGTIMAGLVTGLTDGLKGQKSIAEQMKELADAETALAEAEKKRREAIKDDEAGPKAYEASTLVVYPFGRVK